MSMDLQEPNVAGGTTEGVSNHHQVDVDGTTPLCEEASGGTQSMGKPSLRTLKKNLMRLCSVPLSGEKEFNNDHDPEVVIKGGKVGRKKCCTKKCVCLGLFLFFVLVISLLALSGSIVSIVGLATGDIFFHNRCEYDSWVCENGGTCIPDPPHDFFCKCPYDVYGERCENDNRNRNDPCVDRDGEYSSPQCKNGGTCIKTPRKNDYGYYDRNRYTCICPEGYFGQNCEQNYMERLCADKMCYNGGTCVPLPPEDSMCLCSEGYYGNRCEQVIPTTTRTSTRRDICSFNLCKHGGTCVARGTDDFQCYCEAGYTGRLCEQRQNQSMGATPHVTDKCSNKDICLHGGTCVTTNNDYMCICTGGYYGRHCENY